MVDKYIEQAPDGEKAVPTGLEKLPITDDIDDWWIRIQNLRPGFGREDYKIVPSVTSNNLTVAIKYFDNTDASSTKRIFFRIGDTEYTLSAAVSFTKNAGTNWCSLGSAELAAQNVDLFLYAIGETGAAAGLKFAFSRIPYAETMGDFVNTTTNEKYIAGNWTNFNGTDAVVNIGRFRAQLSAAASHNWSMPSAKVINRPITETYWLAYVPQWTSTGTAPALGDGVMVGKYKIRHSDIAVFMRQTMGSTTTFGTGSYTWSMPFSAATFTNGTHRGSGAVFDSSTSTRYVAIANVASASAGMTLASDVATAGVGATVPITFAVSDLVDISMEFLPIG